MMGLYTSCWTPDCNLINSCRSCAYPEALNSTAWGPSKLEVVYVRIPDAVAPIDISKLQAVTGQSIADKVSLPANA